MLARAAASIFLPVLSLLALFSFVPHAMAQESGEVNDQIVRLSLVQGDVRVARGKDGEHATGGDWGAAAVNLPLQTGFSLVTGGDGRAEIELEDASTVYLGPDSVLTCDLLAEQDGAPHTVLTLVSGVATVHVEFTAKNSSFVLNSAAARLSVWDRRPVFARVNSYLDASQVSPLEAAPLYVDGQSPRDGASTETLTYYADHHVTIAPRVTGNPYSAWDTWTMQRVAARNIQMRKAMQEAGLTEPLPGLADLVGHGRFFACAPYGTCWEPANPAPAAEAPATAKPVRWNYGSGYGAVSGWGRAAGRGDAPHLVLAAQFIGADPDGFNGPYGPYGVGWGWNRALFPCAPIGRFGAFWDTGYVFDGFDAIDDSYDWAVCHAGSWLYRNRGYAWVVTRRQHHHPPVRWVKYNGKTGFVPIHPGDQRGKPPMNLQHGVFEWNDQHALRAVAFDAGMHVKELNRAPKDFSSVYYPPIHSAATPRPMMQALLTPDHNSLEGKSLNGKTIARVTSAPVLFNPRSQELEVQRQEFHDGHMRAVTEHFGGVTGMERASASGTTGLRGSFDGARGSSFHGSGAVSAAAARSGVAGSGSFSHSGGGGGHAGGGASGGGGSHGGGSAGGGGGTAGGTAGGSGGGHR